MAAVRLFASARDAVGAARVTTSARTVGAAVDELVAAHPALAELLETCAIWVNGEPAQATDPLADGDELAILPPVSGG